MGRVPKKHRQYTEAVDADEIDKSGENKSDTVEELPVDEKGAKEIEKKISGNGKADQDDGEDNGEDGYGRDEEDDEDDDFKSVHSDAENKDTAANEGSDEEEEPLKKKSRTTTKAVSKVKRANVAPKKSGRKPTKKPETTNDEEYEVQEIVGHRVERGVDFYLVRWKGYKKDDDTWEPSSTLSCPALIEKFKNKQTLSKDKLKKKPAAEVEKRGRKPKTSTKQDDPDKQWEVEKIIDYAEEKNGRIFRIRWKGYGSKHDTWEPEKNLSCDEVIAKFMQRIKSQEFVSFKELREAPKKPKRLVNETSLPRNFNNPNGRKSKRSTTKKRVFYGDSD